MKPAGPQYFRGIGLMSGTSLDGVDIAFCEYSLQDEQWAFELLVAETLPYDAQWYARLRCLDEQSAETYAKTNVYLGHLHGRMLEDFSKRHELKPQFVGTHGQTIFHQPQKNFTAQIGDGETIASYLHCPVVTNFRAKDVALGGQGAPLVPFGERFLFPDHHLFLNLGGIANISHGSQAFDACVCNMALNWMARMINPDQGYDADGAIARAGKLIPGLMRELESLPFYRANGPKSLGTEWFQQELLPRFASLDAAPEDILHTLVLHISERICDAIANLAPASKKIMVTGGGSHNGFLMECLQTGLADLGIVVEPVPQTVIDFKEAIIFGFLGLNTLLGRPNCLASATGARVDVCGGSIHLPAGGWGKSLI